MPSTIHPASTARAVPMHRPRKPDHAWNAQVDSPLESARQPLPAILAMQGSSASGSLSSAPTATPESIARRVPRPAATALADLIRYLPAPQVVRPVKRARFPPIKARQHARHAQSRGTKAPQVKVHARTALEASTPTPRAARVAPPVMPAHSARAQR